MATRRALKVYRTSIGFQDAYVAAPSQKAALAAWGTEKNLFARGAAEIVTDAKAIKAALAQPGVVLRQARGTPAEHLAAATKSKVAPSPPPTETAEAAAKPKARKARPRPSRDKLRDGEQALDKQRETNSRELARLDAEIERLRDERSRIRAQGEAEISLLEDRRDKEAERYSRALDAWDDA
jgi:hypothetical protein